MTNQASAKKGKYSAAVARQYNGRIGKVDNCQVGVFSSLSNGANATLIGARLLIPDEWVKDEQRCLKAGIPKDMIKAASKIDLARDLIEQADAGGVQYARIGVDSFYGRDTGLLCWIEDRGGEFHADSPENTYIWLSKPPGEKPPWHGRLSNAPMDWLAQAYGYGGIGRTVRDARADAQWQTLPAQYHATWCRYSTGIFVRAPRWNPL